MAGVFRYFWFVFIPLMAVNAVVMRRRLQPSVQSGRVSADEANEFVRAVFLAVVIPAVVLGLIQLGSDIESPLCLAYGDPHRLAVQLTWLVIVVGWVLFGRWLWWGEGASTLVRFAPALQLPQNPRIVRLVLTLVLLGGLFGPVLVFSGAIPVVGCS